MYGKNHNSIVINLQLIKINGKKILILLQKIRETNEDKLINIEVSHL